MSSQPRQSLPFLSHLAGSAFGTYQARLQAHRRISGHQLDIEEAIAAREWHGIWQACEGELHRAQLEQGASHG